MSAFQAYAGAYEHDGQTHSWRCYATTRIHAIRRREHAPLPKAPPRLQWSWRSPLHHEPDVAWLVDEGAAEFSHILLQIQPATPIAARLAEAV